MKRLLLILALLCPEAWATTQLFFQSTPDMMEAGAPAGFRRMSRRRGASAETLTMNNVAGTTAIQWTYTAGGTDAQWCSDPFLASTAVNGNISMNLRGSESNNNDNISFRWGVYKWTSGGGLDTGSPVIDSQELTELGTSEAARTQTVDATNTTFAAGDRLCVRVYADDDDSGAMTAGTAKFFVAGPTAAASGDSYITVTEDLPLVVTRTVKSSGGDYTSLSLYEAGEQGDLPTLLEIHQAELYSMADTTPAVFAGWTTDATYYIKLFTPTSERSATGIYDTSKYRLEITGAHGINPQAGAGFLVMDGLQIKITESSLSPDGIALTGITSGAVKISNCIFKGVFSSTATAVGIYAVAPGSGSPVITAWNNVFVDWKNGANAVNAMLIGTLWTANLYNNTIYNCDKGIVRNLGTTISINNVAMSCNDGFNGTLDASSDYNASDIASDAPGAHSQNGAAATFVNAAGGDLRPASSDTVAKGNGTTDPGSGLFSTDITLATRTVPWDIGAFKAQAATTCGGSSSIALMGVGCR
jgi:hypothetical protein